MSDSDYRMANSDQSADLETSRKRAGEKSVKITRLGSVRDLTAGSPDLPLADGSMKPNGYKDI